MNRVIYISPSHVFQNIRYFIHKFPSKIHEQIQLNWISKNVFDFKLEENPNSFENEFVHEKKLTSLAYVALFGSTCMTSVRKKPFNQLPKTFRVFLETSSYFKMQKREAAIVLCNNEKLLAIVYVTNNLANLIYTSSKFTVKSHDLFRNGFWQCLLSIDISSERNAFFLQFRENCHQIESSQKKETIFF